MARKKKPDDDLITAGENLYKGTTEEIVKVSLLIAQASETMDKSVFALYKEQTNINTKIFSNPTLIRTFLLKKRSTYLPHDYCVIQ